MSHCVKSHRKKDKSFNLLNSDLDRNESRPLIRKVPAPSNYFIENVQEKRRFMISPEIAEKMDFINLMSNIYRQINVESHVSSIVNSLNADYAVSSSSKLSLVSLFEWLTRLCVGKVSSRYLMYPSVYRLRGRPWPREIVRDIPKLIKLSVNADRAFCEVLPTSINNSSFKLFQPRIVSNSLQWNESQVRKYEGIFPMERNSICFEPFRSVPIAVRNLVRNLTKENKIIFRNLSFVQNITKETTGDSLLPDQSLLCNPSSRNGSRSKLIHNTVSSYRCDKNDNQSFQFIECAIGRHCDGVIDSALEMILNFCEPFAIQVDCDERFGSTGTRHSNKRKSSDSTNFPPPDFHTSNPFNHFDALADSDDSEFQTTQDNLFNWETVLLSMQCRVNDSHGIKKDGKLPELRIASDVFQRTKKRLIELHSSSIRSESDFKFIGT